ncbi:hypothetical protein H2200_004782 [Cladophialophora chaetospira]|uniref:Major facilitator superfamily transporter n=1 Tax=Cladophialophora chaetospira TaxID=386627 RepID=A0AA39CKH3_9EURO|nr:hypothetical protein H2200_004782 [Cladophialophora chaetospira]
MGLLEDSPVEPETPPPSWSPAKYDIWKKPSRWQICMPRLRLVAKILGTFIACIIVIKILSASPPPAPPTPEPVPEVVEPPIQEVTEPPPPPPPTEDELMEMTMHNAKKEKWIWKDFPTHDGLTRGTSHLRACETGEVDCKNKSPHLVRYDGYRSFQEPLDHLVSCIGPRGVPLNESDEDAIWAYPGHANGAVEPVIGSYEASGLDGTVSFDRVGRFQAYGIDQWNAEDLDEMKTMSDVDWDLSDWGEMQDACVVANKHRFRAVKERPANSIQYSNLRHKHDQSSSKSLSSTLEPGMVNKAKRTAILIRVWTGAKWTADAVMNIRAMIAEASLASGGKYQVFLLLHVKDEKVPLFVGEDEPQATINKYIPPEFRSITEVWNHAQIRSLYSNLAEHAFVGRSPWMIIQWFARNHPEFDFFYQWEFDVRYTGHYLDFFNAVENFGREQPRKGIWERAGRVYIPSAHGDFDTDFRNSTRDEDPHHVWGPVSVEGVRPRGPKAPKEEEDNYEWGVGEDADWIGFLPSFNVTGTGWWFRNYIWGYAQGSSTPRRATLIAQGRVSRRLLDIMNYENAENGHHIDAEMFPQTMCLHHGLKSTTFPHPVFADRHWPAEALQSTFNGGPFGQAGGYWNSTFSKWNEYAWTNMTWYYSSAQAMPIYQRLLGITALESGGQEWETVYGKTVVRPMLLHPVKGAKTWQWAGADGWLQTKGHN